MPQPESPDKALLAQALAIFEQAVEQSGDERIRYLDAACADSPELRPIVEDLFRHHESEEFQTSVLLASATPQNVLSGSMEGARLGGYTLLSRAGMGGMGVVYRAQQDQPQRIVALKVMRIDLASDELLRRFQREVHLLAQLQHPGIAQVFDAGTLDTEWGTMPYFAMEYLDGQSIDRFVSEQGMQSAAICQLLIQVCEAVQHAHERGVVHRDLKPCNVMVIDRGNGSHQAKILDFGIARSLLDDVANSQAHTLTGQMLGTIGYMSPERTRGDVEADHRADIYSLGVILYELLSGRLPFDLTSCSLSEVARVLDDHEPTKLGRHDTRFRGDLETIVSKALAREPEHRYPSAAALADDLQRYLHSKPIRARPLSAWYLLRKSIRRHRTLFGGLAATIVTLVIGLVATLSLAEHNDRLAKSERMQREQAVSASDKLKVTSENLRETLYRAEMRFVSQASKDPRGRERARLLLNRWDPANDRADAVASVAGANEPDLRQFEWFLANNLVRTERLILDAPRDSFIVWSAAGIEFVSDDKWVLVDPATGQVSQRPRFRSPANALRFAENHDFCVSGQRYGFQVTRKSDNSVVADERLAVVNDARISSEGRFVAVTAMPDRVDTMSIYDVQAQRYVRKNMPNVLGRRSFEFSNQGRWFAEAVITGKLNIWAAPDFATPRLIELPLDPPHAMDWSEDDSRLAIGYRNGPIDLIDVASGKVLRRLIGHDGCVVELRWNRDMTQLLSSSSDSTVRIWDTETGSNRILGGHHGDSRRIAWSPDETQVVSSGYDFRLRIFDVEGSKSITYLDDAGRSGVRGIAWNRDGGELIVDYDATTLHFDPQSETVLRRLPGKHVRFSASGRFYAAVRDSRLELREVSTDQLLATQSNWGRSLYRWHPDEDKLAVAHEATGMWLWDARAFTEQAATWQQLHDKRRVHHFEWHPDGKSLMGSGGSVYCFWLRQTADGWQNQQHPHPGNAQLWAAAPDASLYVIQYANREFQVVDLATGEIRNRLLGQTDDGTSVAWSPDGMRIATAGRAGLLRLWDPKSADEVFSLQLDGATSKLAWHPEGDRLALLVGDRVLVLDARPNPPAPSSR
jgi:eukaryotic-like serine/threonine-protein kinase